MRYTELNEFLNESQIAELVTLYTEDKKNLAIKTLQQHLLDKMDLNNKVVLNIIEELVKELNINQPPIFKVNDTVYDFYCGEGIIISTNHMEDYPVLVEFPDTKIQNIPITKSYTNDGRFQKLGNILLSHNKIENVPIFRITDIVKIIKTNFEDKEEFVSLGEVVDIQKDLGILVVKTIDSLGNYGIVVVFNNLGKNKIYRIELYTKNKS